MRCDACDVGGQNQWEVVVGNREKDHGHAPQKCRRPMEHDLKRPIAVNDYNVELETGVLCLERLDSVQGFLIEAPAVQILIEYLDIELCACEVLLHLARQ